ncbi:MAG: hypothetical protein ABI678_30455, partial [Kofleriaceae bacterium]
FAVGCPLWAVSSLAAIAQRELLAEPHRVVIAVLDARRDEVYAGAYRRDGDRTVAIGEERVIAPAALDLPEGARIAGDFIAEREGHSVTFPITPTGAAVALLALEGARADVLVTGAPTYIRPSEAEVKYPDGVPGALRKR